MFIKKPLIVIIKEVKMKKSIKVVWISSYLPRSCGVAYYSADYISALHNYARKTRRKFYVKIIAHTDASQADYPVINQSDRDWHFKVLKIIKKEKPDVVHIQHEYGLYETYCDGNKRVVDFIKKVKQEGIPVVMTYHSIYKKMNKPFSDFVSETLKELDAGIFHCDYQKKFLKRNIGWSPENVYVIPHGSQEDIKLDKQKVKKSFGHELNELVVGSAGIADERKGFRTLIRQWPKVVKKFPNAVLSLELKPHAAKQTRKYIEKVTKEIMKSPVSKNIELKVRDYGLEEFHRRLKSFDVLVLAYKSESQSGVLAQGFAVGTPAVVTDIEGLGAEIRNSNAGIAVEKREYFYKAIIKMLSSKKLRDKYSKNALKYVKNVNGWNIVAKKTFDIYESILEK